MKTYTKRLNSIVNETVLELIHHRDFANKVWIAGGVILDIVMNRKVEDVNDIDLFFSSKEVARDFYFAMGGMTLITETPKSLLFQKDGQKINFVIFKYFKNEQEIFDSFDFTCCKGAFGCNGFIFDKDFNQDVMSRSLVYTPSFRYPISSLLRIKKYEKKGFSISRCEMIKIALQITTHPVTTLSELQEELGSVYGINIIKLWPEDELDDDKFSIQRAIEILSDLPDMTNSVGCEVDYDKPIIFNKINFIKFPITLYKWVRLDETTGKLSSFYDSSFYYRHGINEEYDGKGMFCCELNNLESAAYSNMKNAVAIKLLVTQPEYINECGSRMFTINKCFVNGIVKNSTNRSRM